MTNRVLKLSVAFKFNLEEHKADVGAIIRVMARPCRTGMHCARTVAFVIRSPESPEELMERLAPVLQPLLDRERITNAWLETASRDVVSILGGIDPLVTHIRDAYERIGQRSEPKDMSHTQRRQTYYQGTVKNFEGRAPVEVYAKTPSKRNHPEQPHRPKR